MRSIPAPTAPVAAETAAVADDAVVIDAVAGDVVRPAPSAGRRGRHRRRVMLAALPALGLLGAASVAGPASAGTPGCGVDCVGSVAVARNMTNTYLWYPSSVPTKSTLTLKYMGGATLRTFTESTFSTSHSYDTGPIMKQGAWYQYLISATDASGRTWNESGSFRALERTVTVTFNKVHITDDSDTGAGEISAWGRVNGKAEVKLWNEQSITAVKSVTANKSVTIKQAPAGLTWEVWARDNDVDFGEFDPSGGAPSYSVVENSYSDANVVKKTVTLPNEIGTHTLTSGAGAPNHNLDFGADITITVTNA